MTYRTLGACIAALLTSCATLVGHTDPGLSAADRAATGSSGPVRLVRTPTDPAERPRDTTIAAAARELAAADVVFLGEQHDSADCHAMQLALTKALAAERGEIILSMEMFERDAQSRLDLYLAGTVDEEKFLAGTRPWPNYAAHYRAAVEFAKDNGFEVLAANVYRPIAARVARRGLAAGLGDPWAARRVDLSDEAYRERFDEVMGIDHSTSSHVGDNVFAAQCIKDATMAESIARAIDARGDDAPLVVHWNGRFHSDYGLGTVWQLKQRKPDLNLAVVSMVTSRDVGRALEGDEVNQGHFVIVARPSE